MKLPSPAMNSLIKSCESICWIQGCRSGDLFPQRQSAGLCARITSACPRGKEISGCKREKIKGKIEKVCMDVDDMFVTYFSNVFHDPHRSPQKTKRVASGRLRVCQAVLVMKDF